MASDPPGPEAGDDRRPELTVYHDGACPLCRREIALYQRQSGADAICFVDVAKPASHLDEPVAADLSRSAALSRFHVRTADGRLISGARAFAVLWQTLPGWRWAGRIAALPGIVHALELGYRATLVVRPALQALVRRLERS